MKNIVRKAIITIIPASIWLTGYSQPGTVTIRFRSIWEQPFERLLTMVTIDDSSTIAFSDKDGFIRIYPIAPGRHTLTVKPFGHLPADTNIMISTTTPVFTWEIIPHHPDSLFLGYNEQRARYDISNHQPILLLPGGLYGTRTGEADSLFMLKYRVQYLSPGCTHWASDNYTAYNQLVFDYLERQYGKTWHKEVHKQAIGFGVYNLLHP